MVAQPEETIQSITTGQHGEFFYIKNESNTSPILQILPFWKDVGPGSILVYRCYGKDHNLLHEIETNNSLTINFK